METEQRVDGVQFSRICKRSYKRALRRAQLHGGTMHRGKRLTAEGPALPVHDATRSVKPRIRFMSWNVGGLSALGCQFGLVGERLAFLSFLYREAWQWRHPHRGPEYRSRCAEYQAARTGTRTHSSCSLFFWACNRWT